MSFEASKKASLSTSMSAWDTEKIVTYVALNGTGRSSEDIDKDLFKNEKLFYHSLD